MGSREPNSIACSRSRGTCPSSMQLLLMLGNQNVTINWHLSLTYVKISLNICDMRKIPRIQGIKSLQYFLSLIFRPSLGEFLPGRLCSRAPCLCTCYGLGIALIQTISLPWLSIPTPTSRKRKKIRPSWYNLLRSQFLLCAIV